MIDRGTGMHVDGCLEGYLLPFGEELDLDIPQFDFRVLGVTSISADTHKYGYGLKGTSTLLFRDKALRNACYFFMPEWSGGKYFSRDGVALRWPCRHLGLDGLTRARRASPLREGHLRDLGGDAGEGAESSELRILGEPTFLFAFTSEEFDIYHVNDEMKRRGCSTGSVPERPAHGGHPAADPAGVVDAFGSDLDEAVAYARERGDQPAESAAVYGGVPGGLNVEADGVIRAVMAQLMDAQQERDARVLHGVSRGVDARARASATRLMAKLKRQLRSCDRPRERRTQGRCRRSPARSPRSGADLETGAASGGGAVQDASRWWRQIRALSREVLADPGRSRCGGVVHGQWASTVPVDSAGEPVGPCIHLARRAGPATRERRSAAP